LRFIARQRAGGVPSLRAPLLDQVLKNTETVAGIQDLTLDAPEYAVR
jgi:hypothetical protein